MNLLYKTKKWDNEIKRHTKVMKDFMKFSNGVDMQTANIKNIIKFYLHPDTVPKNYPGINDESSLWYQIGGEYSLLSWYKYQLESDTVDSAGYMYLYVLAAAKAYELWKSGVAITNAAVLKKIQEMQDMERICFSAVAVNEFPVFEKYAAGNGRIITAMFHEDYEEARQLICKLPDTKEMYAKNKNYNSYYFNSCFLKDLYLSILEQDEEAFNKALTERIKNVRSGYILPIDIVSISMIKFAAKRGLNHNIDVIEIPKFFLDNDLVIDKEKFTLPDLNPNL